TMGLGRRLSRVGRRPGQHARDASIASARTVIHKTKATGPLKWTCPLYLAQKPLVCPAAAGVPVVAGGVPDAGDALPVTGAGGSGAVDGVEVFGWVASPGLSGCSGFACAVAIWRS